MFFLIDPSVPLVALTGTAVIFLSFTITAMMTERRSQLYLGGLLGAGITLLLGMGLISAFTNSQAIMSAELYLGLLVFAGYVVFDTQVMIERAEQHRRDVPRDALNLFMNLIEIFTRLMIILARQNQEERDKKKRRDKK